VFISNFVLNRFLTRELIFFHSADESIKDILQAKFTDFAADDADYPDTSNIMKLSSFPKPIPTKASELLVEARKKRLEEANAPVHKFCMKKFQNIPAKIHVPGRDDVSPTNKTSKKTKTSTTDLNNNNDEATN
jgi:hypothetical protein